MKKSETKKALKGKTPAELQTELEALLKEQFGLRMQVATQQLQDTSKLKNVRRGIARVRTLLDEGIEDPSRNERGRPLRQIPGMTPSLLELAPGCPFRERCARASAACAESPAVTEPAPGRRLRCFHPVDA